MSLSRCRLLFFTAAALTFSALQAGAAHADAPTKQQCVAANESAQDLQGAGKLIEAREQLETCAASACPAVVRSDCTERLRAVTDALPTVVLTPKDAGGGDASLGSLAIDGVAQTAPLDGKPVAVDPGTHTFTITLAGRSPASLRLTLSPGDHVRRDVVFRAEPAPTGAARGTLPSEPAAAAPPVRHVGNTPLLRRIGWAALGAGAAGLTLSTAFGILAIANKAAFVDKCQGFACKPSAQSDIDYMHINGVASNIGLAVGIVGVGAGGALLFLFPETASDTPRDAAAAVIVRPWAGLGDVGVRGTFR